MSQGWIRVYVTKDQARREKLRDYPGPQSALASHREVEVLAGSAQGLSLTARVAPGHDPFPISARFLDLNPRNAEAIGISI